MPRSPRVRVGNSIVTPKEAWGKLGGVWRKAWSAMSLSIGSQSVVRVGGSASTAYRYSRVITLVGADGSPVSWDTADYIVLTGVTNYSATVYVVKDIQDIDPVSGNITATVGGNTLLASFTLG